MNANAPAYPHDFERAFSPGLTKRELFAAMAMQGFCASVTSVNSLVGYDYEVIAKAARAQADELLAALEKR